MLDVLKKTLNLLPIVIVVFFFQNCSQKEETGTVTTASYNIGLYDTTRQE